MINTNNNVLLVLRDKDVFINAMNTDNIVWKDRPTGKVVLFDDENRIALIGNKVNDFFLLPGGGIGTDEDIIKGLKRECREETGCEIEILQELGITEDFRARDSKHCISYGYTARVISCGTITLTESEIDIGVYVKWVSLSDAHKIFAHQEEKVKQGAVRFYNTCFNIIRDSLFIRRAQEIISQ